jgi:hypothetical protein
MFPKEIYATRLSGFSLKISLLSRQEEIQGAFKRGAGQNELGFQLTKMTILPNLAPD